MAAGKDRESSLWAWLRDGLKGSGLRHHVQRVENSVKVGTPDVEGIIEGGLPFWIELKVATVLVSRPQLRVETTAHQVFFAQKRWQVGGNSWYLIRAGKHPRWEHFLVPGEHSELLHSRAVDLAWLREVSAADPRSSPKELMLAAGQARPRLP